MSKPEQSDERDDRLARRLRELRQQLESGDWPEGARQLADELSWLNRGPAADPDDETFTFALGDALEGVDISRRYPNFYRQLLADPVLRRQFIEAIEILIADTEGTLEPLPESIDIDLSFLGKEQSTVAGGDAPSRWRLMWQRTARQLEETLGAFLSPPELALRSSGAFPEDDYLTLLDEVREVGGQEVALLLGATRYLANPDVLHLSLIVSVDQAPSAPLHAEIRWGRFETALTVGASGVAEPPPVPLAAIVDDEGGIGANLQIILSSHHD